MSKPLGCLGIIVFGVILYSFTSNLLSSAATVATSASQIGEVRETAHERRRATVVPATTTPSEEAIAANGRLVPFAGVAELAEMQRLDHVGVVTAPTLNQRSEPNTEASIVGTLSAGLCVHVVGEHNGWYRTRMQASESWSSAEFIAMVDACPTAMPTAP